MKTFVLSTFSLLITISSFSQGWFFGAHFDDSLYLPYINIDTISNPNNSWQVGAPQKTTFTSAYSIPNVIVTDTLNYYPINDNSYFTYSTNENPGFHYHHTVILEGNYHVNTDSLNDYGTIEFSPDNGQTWIDILNDPAYNSYIYWEEKPVLTGNSNGWKHFRGHLEQLGSAFEIGLDDTTKYRFGFHSDGLLDSLDGLMYDDLYFENSVEGLEEKSILKFTSIVFPNPSISQIKIEFENKEDLSFDVVVFDEQNREVLTLVNQHGEVITMNTAQLQNGIYSYALVCHENQSKSYGKFVKN